MTTLHASGWTPALSLSSPANDAVVWGNVSLTASADGPGFTDLQFLVSGAPVGAPITSGSCRTTWSTTGLSDGTYTVTAVAHDSAGTAVYAAPVLVQLRNGVSEIFGVTVEQITDSSARIGWQTTHAADSRVEFGLSSSYSAATPLDPTLVTSHAVLLTGLAPSTTFHFRAASTTSAGFSAVSADQAFQTATPQTTTTDPTQDPNQTTTNDPGTTDPGTTDPGTTDPANTDPGTDPPPDPTPDPPPPAPTVTVSSTGTMVNVGSRRSAAWGIEDATGLVYRLSEPPHPKFQKERLRVSFTGSLTTEADGTLVLTIDLIEVIRR